MTFWQRLPHVALSLLVSTYGLLAWYWAVEASYLREVWLFRQFPLTYWLVLVLAAIVLAWFMQEPFQHIRSLLPSLFDSSRHAFSTVFASSFMLVVVGSTVGVLLILRKPLITNALLLICAASLTRLDLQTHKFGEWQAFWILLIFSLLGIGIGGGCHWLWSRGLPTG